MPQIAFSDGLLGRPRLGLPSVRAINCYAEKSAEGPTANFRTARPGLTRQYTIGAGPILRTFQKPGLFNGDPFFVSGGGFYRGQTLLGTVAYGPNPRIVAAQGYLALVVGGALYIYNGTTFTAQTTFDDGVSLLPAFSSVAVLFNIFVYSVAGSNQFFFSRVGSPQIINAGNFGAAQTSPTPIIDMAVNAEEIYFFKTDATEIWDFNGALTAPFAESPGRTYSRGCAAQGSVAQLDNALIWVGDDYAIYRSSTVPQRLTENTSWPEDRLKAAGAAGVAQCVAMTFNIEGHVFYVLHIPTLAETFAFDVQTALWFQWGTQANLTDDPVSWIGYSAGGVGQNIYVGSGLDGRVFLLDEVNHTDDGLPMRIIVAASHWINEGILRANNLSVQMVRGVATGAVPAPQLWLRWSDDGAQTWETWVPGSVGPIGGYRFKASWHSLGFITQPGRIFEIAAADAVNVTLESVTLNPARR